MTRPSLGSSAVPGAGRAAARPGVRRPSRPRRPSTRLLVRWSNCVLARTSRHVDPRRTRTTLVCAAGGWGAWSVATGVAGSSPAASSSPGCGGGGPSFERLSQLREPSTGSHRRSHRGLPGTPTTRPGFGSTAIVSPGRSARTAPVAESATMVGRGRFQHESAGRLEHRGLGRVADEPVDEAGARPVHRSGPRHTEVGVPRPPAVLHRRRHPRM